MVNVALVVDIYYILVISVTIVVDYISGWYLLH